MTYFKKQIFFTIIATFSFAPGIFCAAPYTQEQHEIEQQALTETLQAFQKLRQQANEMTTNWATEYHEQEKQKRAEQRENKKRKNKCKQICDSCLAM